MTLQVGLVGMDGLGIASDKKASIAEDGTRTSSTTQKRFWDTETRIVFAASGDWVAPHVARELVRLAMSETTSRDDVFTALQTGVEELWQKHVPKKRNGDPDRNPKVSFLVGLVGNPYHLWRISHPKTASGTCHYLDKIHNGDPATAAKYFTERFYKSPNLLPIDQVVFLAAHTIIEGGKLNPTMVEGLDVLTWKFEEREPRHYSEGEKAELTRRSEDQTDTTRTSLMGAPAPRA